MTVEIPPERLPLLALLWLISGLALDNQLLQGSAVAALFIAGTLPITPTVYERK